MIFPYTKEEIVNFTGFPIRVSVSRSLLGDFDGGFAGLCLLVQMVISVLNKISSLFFQCSYFFYQFTIIKTFLACIHVTKCSIGRSYRAYL